MVPSIKSQNFEGLFFCLKERKKKVFFFLLFFLSVHLFYVKNYHSQFPKCSCFTFSAVLLQLIPYNSAYNKVVLASLLPTRFAISNTAALQPICFLSASFSITCTSQCRCLMQIEAGTAVYSVPKDIPTSSFVLQHGYQSIK